MRPHREFRPVSREAAAAAVRERFHSARRSFFRWATLQPRKNHIGLIRAFARLARAYPQLKHKLVLAGKPTWFADRVREAARESGVADRIQFFGFVSDGDLLQLYNACESSCSRPFTKVSGCPRWRPWPAAGR